MRSEDSEGFVIICKIGGWELEKDSIKVVVDCFWFRGPLSSTRLGELVVRPVLSCLGYVSSVGMDDGGDGSRDCLKRV